MPKRHLGIEVFLLVSLCLLALVNLAIPERCEDLTEPTCTEEMWVICETEVCPSHGGCQEAEWRGNWCWDNVCYEDWTLWCNDGYYESQYCAVQKPRVYCD